LAERKSGRSRFRAGLSSSEHGYLKSHPSIFEAACGWLHASGGVCDGGGDSLLHDIEGARRVGMRGVLAHRGAGRAEVRGGIPVIRDLSKLLDLI
jgi:FMN phosphatase YigB (HAD superfamily)